MLGNLPAGARMRQQLRGRRMQAASAFLAVAMVAGALYASAYATPVGVRFGGAMRAAPVQDAAAAVPGKGDPVASQRTMQAGAFGRQWCGGAFGNNSLSSHGSHWSHFRSEQRH